MKQTIWKYPPDVKDTQAISMPIGAQIITMQVQDGMPNIWALVDPEAKTELRTFYIYGTGEPLDVTHQKYIGTFQYRTRLVFHVFEAGI